MRHKMENFPETLFVGDGSDGASSSTVRSELSEIKQHLKMLNVPLRKRDALEQLLNGELRICSLAVIVRLVQVEDTNTPEIIRFLLETQTLAICLRCIDVGSELAKKGSVCSYSNCYVNNTLRKTVDGFGRNQPNPELLKQILNCYMQLVEVSRLFSGCDALSEHYPANLKNTGYLNYACRSEIKSLEVLLIECS
ncbi:hypothetical protein Lser_V15G45666 [Lactuca serriola]